MSFSYKNKKEILNDFFASEIDNIDSILKKEKSLDFLSKIQEYEKDKNTFILKYRQVPLGIESFFVVLRKWNSYTPSLPSLIGENVLNQHSIGGGYFLFIQSEEETLDPGYGLVIDPGYNFIHNFGLAGFCLDDIDGVLITHAHNDHTSDFESILSLLYQRNKKFIGKRKEKKVDLFFNVGAFKKFSNYLDLASKDKKNYIGKVTVMSPCQVYEIPDRNLNFKILTLHTKHHEIITADYSLGICFKIDNRNIYLTSDTGWDFDMTLKNETFLQLNGVHTRENKENDNIDLLIAHLGSLKKEEFEVVKNDKDFEEKYYENHLGILGIISVIEQWKPDLCIISEFGEELTNLRSKLSHCVETISKKLYKKIKCIPGDIGLFLLLDSKKCLSYSKTNLINWEDILYKDIKDRITNQWDIYYFSNDIIDENRNDNYLKNNVKIINGLQFVSECWFKTLLKEYNIKEEKYLKLLLLKEIHETKTPINDIFLKESIERTIIGNLLILSYLIKADPIEVLNVNYPGNLALLLDFLNAYNVETSVFYDFMFFLQLEGFDIVDDDKEIEEIKKHKDEDYLKLLKLFLIRMTKKLPNENNLMKEKWIVDCEEALKYIKEYECIEN